MFAVISILLLTVTVSSANSDADDAAKKDASYATAEDGASEDKTFFDSVYTALFESASEIFSALAFAGSLVIMLSYNRGLIPLINDGIKALKTGVKTINEKTEAFNEHAIGLCDSIDARLMRAEKLEEAVISSAESVEEQLNDMQHAHLENEKIKTVLTAQIDMLYEIFMSAALPQYLKDSVGERVGRMKAELGKEAHDENIS